jgi:SAM-dependent methyltransferase
LESGYITHFSSSKNLNLVVADFSRTLDIPLFDGILMANSLHFFKDKEKILLHVRSLLKPKGILIIVEYNVDTGNSWVPYPFSFGTFRELAAKASFTEPHLLATIPSRFLREFYSALVYKKDN